MSLTSEALVPSCEPDCAPPRYDGRLEELVGQHAFLRDNDAILGGYRMGMTVRECLRSMVRWHNESVNVWTHLLGALATVVLAVMVFYHNPVNPATGQPVADHSQLDLRHCYMILIYLLSAFLCLFSSAFFHVFYCVSERALSVLRSFDYTSISLLDIASSAAVTYFFFYCQPVWLYTYLSLLLVVGTIVNVYVLIPRFWNPRYRAVRTTVYVVFGLLSGAPALHALWLPGMTSRLWWQICGWFIATGVAYILGAIFYMTRIPERYMPGKLDYIIFHMWILAAVGFHYVACLHLLDWRLASQFQC